MTTLSIILCTFKHATIVIILLSGSVASNFHNVSSSITALQQPAYTYIRVYVCIDDIHESTKFWCNTSIRHSLGKCVLETQKMIFICISIIVARAHVT